MTLTAAAAFGMAPSLAAQSKPAQTRATSPKHPHHAARHRHPAARHQQDAAAKPQAPAPPDWPANQKPNPAQITWNARGLKIVANNSSLDQILHEVGADIGATISGFSRDQRVFGTYGPGTARDVLSQLLNGSGYNVLMVGDQGNGTPRQIELSDSAPGSASPQAAFSSGEPQGAGNENPPAQPPQAFPRPVPLRSPFPYAPPPRSPQESLRQMRQSQLEQMRRLREQQQDNSNDR